MKRRHLLLGLGAAGLGAAAWLKPSDLGAPYSNAFSTLNQMLRSQGAGKPQLLIDLDALDHNIAALKQILKPQATLRLVEKSLPSLDLLAYIRERTGSNALMSFHWPFLRQSAERFAQSDILLGKPMPAQACAQFYQRPLRSAFNPEQQLTWLIDTPERLQEYLAIAQAHSTKLRIAIELDVGLHRGGVRDLQQLTALLTIFQAHPQHLALTGLMGYDAHVGKVPSLISTREQSYQQACALYRQAIDQIQQHAPSQLAQQPIFNGAGSPTIALHRDNSPCNDLSAGSCLLLPSDFDLATLQGFKPAAFIAAPILKTLPHTEIPGLERLAGGLAAWDPQWQQAHFIYGGHWLADPWQPQGVTANPLYGHSSNQMLYNASKRSALAVNDHVFLRPRQSESVLLQFGDLLAVRNGQIVAQWPVLSENA
ncbi:alanine racemase [Atopomonas sediminilitoris]|uniref:alanine racemase n=1 Tax=Atopomonas sediminilitoris TaxID=2919919 RepID=UPI001F4E0019|nr:alanine racemase [Atopomonas sediminilitoris]MCJ8169049.1 alanine racemase [Atopomonas sediminilitoris]